MKVVKKKEPLQRTKVVIRHLPPSLSQSNLFSQFDHLFSHRYNWVCFRPGKSSHKHQKYSRAYIDFKTPEDVLEFAQFFGGHVFVNQKGAQFKAMVEYAPCQHIPKLCNKKDSREGTIYEDPEYLDFLKLIAKPVENRSSTKFQLERKEADESGASTENPISTPLMEFVRQKRAAKGGNQSLSVAKVRKRAGSASLARSNSKTTKQGSDKKKYAPKDNKKNSKKEKQILHDSSSGKGIESVSVSGVENSISRSMSTADSGTKRILLRKGKESEVYASILEQSGQASTSGNSPTTGSPKQRHRHGAGERLLKVFLSNSVARQSRSVEAVDCQQKMQNLNLEKGKQSRQPVNAPADLIDCTIDNKPPLSVSNGDNHRPSADKFMKKDSQGLSSVDDKRKRRARNKDRPDHGGQTLQKSSFQQANHQRHLSTACERTELHSKSAGGTSGEMKDGICHENNNGLATGIPNGGNNSSVENGSSRHVATHNKKGDGFLSKSRESSSKRGGATGHEKRLWVQKSTSGS